MKKLILLAGILSLASVGLHVIAGGVDVHEPLFHAAPSALMQTFISVLWHGVTTMLAINGFALCFAAFSARHRNSLVLLISCQYFAYGTIFIIYGIVYMGDILQAPQWIIFDVIALLSLIGLRKLPITQSRISV